MLRNSSEKLGARFCTTTLGSSLVRISYLDDVFLGPLELEASSVEDQHLQQKETCLEMCFFFQKSPGVNGLRFVVHAQVT